MKESQIRKLAIDKLKADGWVCWYSYKSKWAKESDIFGVYDLVICKGSRVRWIQLTTIGNIGARKRKIEGFLRATGARLPSYVWGWDKKKKIFKTIKLNHNK